MKNRKILVVGGTSGIGRATVTRLVDRGDSVVVWSRNVDGGPDGAVTRQSVDVRESIPTDAVPDDLDGLVYCPGSINLAAFNRLDDAAFRDDFEINVLGAVRVIRAALPSLQSGGGGSIVLFSTVAVSVGMGFHASVAAAKGALEGLGRSLAAELAPRGIRVNLIAPSLTDTPAAGRLLSSDAKRERAAARHPLGRVGDPDDMAAAAAYFLGDDSGWVTGQVLHVDGGLSSLRLL